MNGVEEGVLNPIPISALQHVTYCRRRAALIHLDREWRENVYTAQGRVAHRRADWQGARRERRRGVSTHRGVTVWSDRLGLVGIADVVEYRRDPATGERVPFPVEYKRGRAKQERAYEIQLCAQALCLEEMTGLAVTRGALLYAASRKRVTVEFDAALRARCVAAIHTMRELLTSQALPPSEPGPKCRKCSMQGACMPRLTDGTRSVRTWLNAALARE